MKNIADIPDKTKWTAYASLESFGVTIPNALFEEWAEWAMDAIGRNDVEVRIASQVRANGEVILPCDINTVESVTLDMDVFATWRGSKIDEDGTINSSSTYDYSPNSHNSRAPYVDFEIVNRHTIRVNPLLVDSYIYVKADVLLVDTDGELLFTDKQIKAMIEYVIALKAKREYLAGMPAIDHVQAMKDANKLVLASKVPTYISDNELDRMLNVRVSFDRKMYNQDFKIND